MSSKYVDVFYDHRSRELRTPTGVIGKVVLREVDVTQSLEGIDNTYQPTMSVAGATAFETYYPHFYVQHGNLVTVSGQISVVNITGGTTGQLDITANLPVVAKRGSLTQALHGACTAWMTDATAPASSQTYPGFVELLYDNYPNCNHFHALVHWNRDGTFTTGPTVDSGARISWQFTYSINA